MAIGQAQPKQIDQFDLLKDIVEAYPGLVFRFNPSLRLVYVNPAGLSLLGRSLADLEGRHGGEDPFLSELLAPLLPDMYRSLERCQSIEASVVLRSAAGSDHHYLAQCIGTESGLTMFCRDMCDERSARDELIDATHKAEASDRAKSAFLENLSHELRTPMVGIVGALDLLAEGLAGSYHQRWVDAIRESSNALLTLFNDLIDLARSDDPAALKIEPVPTRPKSIVDEVISVFASRFTARSLILDVYHPNEDCRVLIDPARLRQILVELIGHAEKGTVEGGVVLRWAIQPAEGGSNRDLTLELVVIDSGSGLDESQRQLIFEPFGESQGEAEAVPSGLGIGMPLVARLLQHMKGSLTVANEPRGGSRYTVQIPCRRPSSNTSRRIAVKEIEAANQGPLSGRRILVVDDNEANRQVLRTMLRQMGAVITTAVDGRTGVQAWSDTNPDLVLMDCMMPVLDGFGATREIRAQEARDGSARPTPILAVTAMGTRGQEERCLESGMDGMICKPFRLADLRQKIEVMLNRP
jgi:signal transduction histidine kinase/CheY-like chemotaxis protein